MIFFLSCNQSQQPLAYLVKMEIFKEGKHSTHLPFSFIPGLSYMLYCRFYYFLRTEISEIICWLNVWFRVSSQYLNVEEWFKGFVMWKDYLCFLSLSILDTFFYFRKSLQRIGHYSVVTCVFQLSCIHLYTDQFVHMPPKVRKINEYYINLI